MVSSLDAVLAVHTIFAALWTGGTLVLAGAVLPAARNEWLSTQALSFISRRFRSLTIVSVLALLFTGGHLAGTLYTADQLQSTGRGHLVLAMVGLWLLLAVALAGGFRQLVGLPADRSAARAATNARPWFLVGSLASLVLLIIAGLL
ncbi:CopD family protein [Halomicrobium sp. LC1Hm]|uniref:CopD family protein n=1 Tax=Halomicrobium sp. LC1Hm TaxID=2610902 RepID=UPI0012984B78|nr:CopD family protein [Halomicrobium sp. LC1Hm]